MFNITEILNITIYYKCDVLVAGGREAESIIDPTDDADIFTFSKKKGKEYMKKYIKPYTSLWKASSFAGS